LAVQDRRTQLELVILVARLASGAVVHRTMRNSTHRLLPAPSDHLVEAILVLNQTC
jgi:hypothetical protein